MSSNVLTIIIHGLILLAIQAFLLVGLSIPLGGRYVASAFIYPLIVLILPLRTPRSAVLIIAFLLGLSMDFFYDSPGVHGGAMVLLAMSRIILLRILEPRGGYRVDTLPTPANYGWKWFNGYAAILVFTFLLAYFTLDVFAIALLDKIIVNALLSFIASYIMMMLYQMLIRK